jgi:hypothetical protein
MSEQAINKIMIHGLAVAKRVQDPFRAIRDRLEDRSLIAELIGRERRFEAEDQDRRERDEFDGSSRMSVGVSAPRRGRG